MPAVAWATTIRRAHFDHLETIWREPDEGIWEVRGPRQHFTHSKVMVWVAFDRAVKSVEQLGEEGLIDRWRMLQDQIHADICPNSPKPIERAVYEALSLPSFGVSQVVEIGVALPSLITRTS